MKMSSNITKRATMAVRAVVRQSSALYLGETTKRAGCPSSLTAGPIGGGFPQGHAFGLEDVLRKGRRQDQIQI